LFPLITILKYRFYFFKNNYLSVWISAFITPQRYSSLTEIFDKKAYVPYVVSYNSFFCANFINIFHDCKVLGSCNHFWNFNNFTLHSERKCFSFRECFAFTSKVLSRKIRGKFCNRKTFHPFNIRGASHF